MAKNTDKNSKEYNKKARIKYFKNNYKTASTLLTHKQYADLESYINENGEGSKNKFLKALLIKEGAIDK